MSTDMLRRLTNCRIINYYYYSHRDSSVLNSESCHNTCPNPNHHFWLVLSMFTSSFFLPTAYNIFTFFFVPSVHDILSCDAQIHISNAPNCWTSYTLAWVRNDRLHFGVICAYETWEHLNKSYHQCVDCCVVQSWSALEDVFCAF